MGRTQHLPTKASNGKDGPMWAYWQKIASKAVKGWRQTSGPLQSFIRSINSHLWSPGYPEFRHCLSILPYVCVVSPQDKFCHTTRVLGVSCYRFITNVIVGTQCFDMCGTEAVCLCMGLVALDWILWRAHLRLSTTILALVDSRSKFDFLGTPQLDVVSILRNVQFRFLWNGHMNSNNQKGNSSSNFLIFFSSVSKPLVCGHWVLSYMPDSRPLFNLKPSCLLFTVCQNPPT